MLSADGSMHDDDLLLNFLANRPGPGYLGGPLTQDGKADKLMDYVKLYVIPHEQGGGYNNLYPALEEAKVAAAAALEARARDLYDGSFEERDEQPAELTDFFKLCITDSKCYKLVSWPGCELRECRHEKRLLCWAWLRAGGSFSALPKDLVVKIAQYLRDPLISKADALKAVAYPAAKLVLRATVDPHIDGFDHRYSDFRATTSRMRYKAPNGATHFTIEKMLGVMYRFLDDDEDSPLVRPEFMGYDMIPYYKGMWRTKKRTFELDLDMDPELDGYGEEGEEGYDD